MKKYLFILGIMTMGLFSCLAKTKEEKFWTWFCKNSKSIYNFESNREVVFDKIQAQLHAVNENLTFEISSIKDEKRDFVISADGIISAFPAVETLYKAKPELSDWTFIKFRPRRKVDNSIKIGNKELFPRDVRFMFVDDEDTNKVGIVLFCNGYNEDEADFYTQISFLFLDESLGEFDTETYIGSIFLQGFDSEYFGQSREIEVLADEFDKIKNAN
ncbi:hypothetical protein [Treponema zioleckii]|uniref:hypothetical protein n=1 Tax=Treponema zioleckii TaxID=331680 RepID=UPI001F5B6B0A|nr:hypothetical protein [Treponema zioleckii]